MDFDGSVQADTLLGAGNGVRFVRVDYLRKNDSGLRKLELGDAGTRLVEIACGLGVCGLRKEAQARKH
jgi:hypothetical protein